MRHATTFFRVLLASALALVLSACAPQHPPAPSVGATADYKYVIGPLDTVNIVVWRNPELSLSVPVRPDGRITTPLVEDVQALGKNPAELARELEKALSKFIRDPVVTVIVTSFNGPFTEQIRIVGEAAKPQAVAYRQKMTLLDVMIVVGGLTDFADGNKAVLVRGTEQGQQYSVRLSDLVRRGASASTVGRRDRRLQVRHRPARHGQHRGVA